MLGTYRILDRESETNVVCATTGEIGDHDSDEQRSDFGTYEYISFSVHTNK